VVRARTIIGVLSLMAMLVLPGAAFADVDTDLDAVLDPDDNCPQIFNPEQDDADDDGVGSSCDPSPGVPAEESWVVLYLRDQEGRAVSDAASDVCFGVVDYLGAAVIDDSVVCSPPDAGYVLLNLNTGEADRQVITQESQPEGCSGSFPPSVEHRFTPGLWRVMTVRYRCGVSFSDTFTAAGQEKPHAVPLAPRLKEVKLRVAWKDSRHSFDIVDIRVVRRGVVVARAPSSFQKLKPGKLKITRMRKATSVNIRITKLKPGRLAFDVRAKDVTGRTTVKTRVVQIK
jgi:hypothetical protein